MYKLWGRVTFIGYMYEGTEHEHNPAGLFYN